MRQKILVTQTTIILCVKRHINYTFKLQFNYSFANSSPLTFTGALVVTYDR